MNTPRPSRSSSMVRRSRPSRASRASRGEGSSKAPATLAARVEERATLPTWTDEQIDELIDQVLSTRASSPSLDDTLIGWRWSFLPPPSTSRRTTVPVSTKANDERADEQADESGVPTLRTPSQASGEPATQRNPRALSAALGAAGLDAVFERETVPSSREESLELDEADLLELADLADAADMGDAAETGDAMSLARAREESGEYAIEIDVVFDERLEELDEWDELPPSLPQRTAMIPPEAMPLPEAPHADEAAALALPTSWAGAWGWMFAGLAALLTLIAGLSQATRAGR